MKITQHKRFDKQFSKLSNNNKKKALDSLAIFCENPFDSSLRNHALEGKFDGLRSIDVSFDLRIIFDVDKKYSRVELLFIGSHAQLYG